MHMEEKQSDRQCFPTKGCKVKEIYSSPGKCPTRPVRIICGLLISPKAFFPLPECVTQCVLPEQAKTGLSTLAV